MRIVSVLSTYYFCLVLYLIAAVRGQELKDVKLLKNQLFENNSYDKFIRPVLNQSKIIEVSHVVILLICYYVN